MKELQLVLRIFRKFWNKTDYSNLHSVNHISNKRLKLTAKLHNFIFRRHDKNIFCSLIHYKMVDERVPNHSPSWNQFLKNIFACCISRFRQAGMSNQVHFIHNECLFNQNIEHLQNIISSLWMLIWWWVIIFNNLKRHSCSKWYNNFQFSNLEISTLIFRIKFWGRSMQFSKKIDHFWATLKINEFISVQVVQILNFEKKNYKRISRR